MLVIIVDVIWFYYVLNLFFFVGDLMVIYNGSKFYVKDWDINECVFKYKGGWWYKYCYDVNFNGFYLKGNYLLYVNGMKWFDWYGYYYLFKIIEMKIRR